VSPWVFCDVAPGRAEKSVEFPHRILVLVFEGILEIDSPLYNFLGGTVFLEIWSHFEGPSRILKRELRDRRKRS
jgi:hypothetical protein